MTYAHATRKQREKKEIATSELTQGNAQNSNQANASRYKTQLARSGHSAGREREHRNSYMLATEGTDKTFIRGQQLL